jgi:cation:H+ antiporter
MIVFLVVGFVLLVKGADFFVDGACNLSDRLKIPAYVIGLTVVAFGTSLPEAAVSITASLRHSNEIAIGNVVGSNVFNTLVVLGASALFAPVAVKKNLLKRDFPFCIIITAVMLALLFTFRNGDNYVLTRYDGIVLLVLFVIFMAYSVIGAKKESYISDEAAEAAKAMPLWKSVFLILIGVTGVIVGGQLTVSGAKSLAALVGLSEKVIALTVVAIGTSLPELVTSVVAARKNRNDIAVGNVIGSNIFNLLFILGISSVIGDITTDFSGVVDASVLTGVMVLTFVFALSRKQIKRAEGIIMILLYVIYTAYLLIR